MMSSHTCYLIPVRLRLWWIGLYWAAPNWKYSQWCQVMGGNNGGKNRTEHCQNLQRWRLWMAERSTVEGATTWEGQHTQQNYVTNAHCRCLPYFFFWQCQLPCVSKVKVRRTMPYFWCWQESTPSPEQWNLPLNYFKLRILTLVMVKIWTQLTWSEEFASTTIGDNCISWFVVQCLFTEITIHMAVLSEHESNYYLVQ